MSTATLNIEKEKFLIPKLRFQGFKNEFHSKIFDEITDITRLAGYEYSQYWQEDENEEIIALRGYNIGKGKLDLKKLAYISNKLSLQLKRSRLFKGDIVYPCVGSIGNAVVIEEDNKFHIQQNIAKITCKKDVSPYFLVQFLASDFGMNEVYRFNASGAQPNVLVGSLRKYQINIPALPEQQKIASFLSAVDEKIQQLSRKKELLEQYKKGLMQQLFSGKLRFKDENGNDYADWEKVNGNILFESISNKNHNSDLPILAITQDQGAIPRDLIDYKVSVTDKSIDSYKVVEVGDFVISLRSFQGGIEYSNYKGICSPAYIILRPTSAKVNKSFYKTYLKTSFYIKELQKNLEGIRDGKMISYKYFSDIKLPFPSLSEQQKIANFLSSIDAKIESNNQQINQTQSFKKGLLQQMFV